MLSLEALQRKFRLPAAHTLATSPTPQLASRASLFYTEKILAAKRAGIKEIILSDENRKNIEEIQEIYLKGLTFHYVKDVKEVFAIALTDEKVADAIDLSVKKEKIEK